METFQGRQFRNTAKAKDKSVYHSEEPTWMNLEDLMTKEISQQKKKTNMLHEFIYISFLE